MSGSTPPLTIGIVDCTEHMAAGGKKDTLYIADNFEDKVEEYDPNHTLTDVVYFDGASNIQNVGRKRKEPASFPDVRRKHTVV